MTVPLPDLFKRITLAQEGSGSTRWSAATRGPARPAAARLPADPRHVASRRPAARPDHTVILTDLRGYGDSGKPPGGATHEGYAKRTMARDQALVMRDLGFDQFAVVGHDRGARVAHRMALDSPQSVTKLAVLDIVPTRHALRTADWTSASATGTGSSSPSRSRCPSTRSAPTPTAGCAAGSAAGGGAASRSTRRRSTSTSAASASPP